MYPNLTKQLPSLLQANMSPGVDATVRLLNGVRTGFIVMEGTCTVTIAVATATGTLNDGSLWALFTKCIFYENGNFVVQRDARSMARMTELLGYAPTSAIRMGPTLTAGAYKLRDHLIIPFAWPLAVNPWDTPFVAIDQNAPNTVGLQLNTTAWTGAGTVTANNVLVTPGASGTAAVTALTINIVQEFDTDLGLLPTFRPFMQDLVSPPITAAITDQIFYIDFPDVLRSLMIQQDTSVGEVGDILTSYQLRTDTTNIDGNGGDLNFIDRVQQMVRWFGGAISAARISQSANPLVNPAYLFRNFQSSGRISNVLVRSQIGANVALWLTGQNSASGAANTSIIRAGMDRLQKVPGVTNPANQTTNGVAVQV